MNGFEWFAQCKRTIDEAEGSAWTEHQDSDLYRTAVMVLFGGFSTDLRVVATYTKYSKQFLRPRMQRARKLGIWGAGYKGGVSLLRWADEEYGDWKFWLDAMTVNGDLDCKMIDGEPHYRANKCRNQTPTKL